MTKTLRRLLTKLEKEHGYTSVRIGNYSIYSNQDGSSEFVTIENNQTGKSWDSDISDKYFERESTIELMYKAIRLIKEYLAK